MPVREPNEADCHALAARDIVLPAEGIHLVSGPLGAPDGIVSAGRKPFESALLSLNVAEIGRLRSFSGSADLAELVRNALIGLRERKFDYVSTRRDERESEAIEALQAGGLRVVECLITLHNDLSRGSSADHDQRIDIATPADADAVATVGGASFTHDRFHADRKILKSVSDSLKSSWARNAVMGRADKVFVSRDAGRITGFNACLFRHGTAIIDLIGIAPGHQRKGLGRALMQAAMSHYSGKASSMLVGTQSRNHASLALYMSLGFRVHGSAFTLSKHLS